MDDLTMLRGIFDASHQFLEGAMADVTPEMAHWVPPGLPSTIGANYAHVLVSEDMAIQTFLQGKSPLHAESWAGRTGLDEPSSAGPGGDLRAWSAEATIDLDALRAYGQAVYAATDEYLQSIEPAELLRPLNVPIDDLNGKPSMLLISIIIANISQHCGEISCLKGIQGHKGYVV